MLSNAIGLCDKFPLRLYIQTQYYIYIFTIFTYHCIILAIFIQQISTHLAQVTGMLLFWMFFDPKSNALEKLRPLSPVSFSDGVPPWRLVISRWGVEH